MLDLLIANGTIVDGSGESSFVGDIGIVDGRIAAVGRDVGPARERIDADGLYVTPGWIDIHTHLDAQAMWDPVLAPCVWHGTTTALMGNCGVGFAPARPADRNYLIEMMAGVEDIPASSLAAGLDWEWESFPEYLDALDRRERTIDVGALMTHAAIRLNVMGERGISGQPTGDDLAAMAAQVRAGMEAGALGLSSSRTFNHRSTSGELVPGTVADESELLALVRAMRATGRGILEVAPAGVTGEVPDAMDGELDWMARISLATGCPITFLLGQLTDNSTEYLRLLGRCSEIGRRGASVSPQVAAKPANLLLSLLGEHPFRDLPSAVPLMNLSHAERYAAMRRPELRKQLIAEYHAVPPGGLYNAQLWHHVFELGSPLNYFPDKSEKSIARLAEEANRDPAEMVYDKLLEQDGTAFLAYFILNWADRDDQALYDQITHPGALVGLGDAGAHVTTVCDASFPSLALLYWVRDRPADDPHRIPIEFMVRKLTSDNARFFGLSDRGLLRPGMRADLNLIDLDAMALPDPQLIHDLPGGMPRLDQGAKGYRATFVAGERTLADGQLTGRRPGRVLRGA